MDDDRALLADVCHNALRLARSASGGLTRVRLQSGDAVVELEWAGTPAVHAPSAVMVVAPEEAEPLDNGTDNVAYVRAPMIGTFYHAPAPGEPAFVREGDMVEAGTQVGILEAMKLMNRIEADCAGRVAKVLVSDGTPVEYDQPLVLIYPLDEPIGQG